MHQLILVCYLSPRVNKRGKYLHTGEARHIEFETPAEAQTFANENGLELVHQPFDEKAFDKIFGSFESTDAGRVS